MKAHAKKLKFVSNLNHLIETSEEKFKKHYRYIMNQLMSEDNDEGNLSELNEDENDVDLLEDEEIGEEDELPDPIEEGYSPIGEDLLKDFELEGKEAENVSF